MNRQALHLKAGYDSIGSLQRSQITSSLPSFFSFSKNFNGWTLTAMWPNFCCLKTLLEKVQSPSLAFTRARKQRSGKWCVAGVWALIRRELKLGGKIFGSLIVITRTKYLAFPQLHYFFMPKNSRSFKGDKIKQKIRIFRFHYFVPKQLQREKEKNKLCVCVCIYIY
jgi:hypothetical protein